MALHRLVTIVGGYRAASKYGSIKGRASEITSGWLDLLDEILDGAKKQALFKEDSEYLSSLLVTPGERRTPY